jgi:hypothetical protein
MIRNELRSAALLATALSAPTWLLRLLATTVEELKAGSRSRAPAREIEPLVASADAALWMFQLWRSMDRPALSRRTRVAAGTR